MRLLRTFRQLVKVVEVKCPLIRARDKTIEQACTDDKSFCCNIVNNTPSLRIDHEYYYQILGQMAITGIKIYDFVIWTPKGIHVQTIHFDSDFWNRTCVPNLEDFLFHEICTPQKPNLPYGYSYHKSHMYQK